MKRFISNYTILACGQELINHITTTSDDGTLLSIETFERELGNTVYVALPLCVVATSDVARVESAFRESVSRDFFKRKLVELNISRPKPGTVVAILKLDFARNIIIKL